MSFHRPIYSIDQIRQLEKQHADSALMQRAGLAISNYVQHLLPDLSSSILLFAGPGNNGGDALVAARLLRDIYPVTVVLYGDKNKLPPDAREAYSAWVESGGEVLDAIPDMQFDLVVDGLLGIGINKLLEGPIAELVAKINRLNTHVLAIDIPSGLCAKTGRILGVAVRADWTMTFLGLKSGLFTLDGPDHAGEVILETLGIEPDVKPAAYLLEQEDVARFLPKRLKNSNKGSYGNLGVLGGATQMTGAAIIAARAALLSGAGRVYAGLLEANAPSFDAMMPELMLRKAHDIFDIPNMACLVIGPGMGQSAEAGALLCRALDSSTTLLLDADALNLLADAPDLQSQCRTRKSAQIMTPHPGEAARLLASTVAEVQSDRITAALEIAKKYHAVTVLKGCGTVIAMPNGDWYINHSGNPGLASAGMGDALAGMIAALIAQKMSPEQAALLGVYIHGAAADALVEHGIGPIGLTASEVMMEVRRMLNQWAEWGQA